MGGRMFCVEPRGIADCKAAQRRRRHRRHYDMHVIAERARKRAEYRKKVLQPISPMGHMGQMKSP
jgi:hypothetical protein